MAALAVTGASSRAYLAGLLWPESSEARAMASLRVALCRVAKAIPGLLVAEGTTLSLSHEVDIDLRRAKQLISRVLHGEIVVASAGCVASLRTGELLPGWYEDFILEEQRVLRVQKIQCMKRLADDAVKNARHDVAVLAARAALELEPYDDQALRLLIHAERDLGNHSGALRIYREYAMMLRVELGSAPSREIQSLILQHGVYSALRHSEVAQGYPL